MKTLAVKVPDALAAWSSRRARARPTAVRLGAEALQRVCEGTSEASCHDVLGDVCGVIEGPKNLSTNPKRPEGFGE